ncbi:hypothetical protein MMC25_002693 [Agyrium rufum]|nr:hypothetical protein [Agyrium rufum]
MSATTTATPNARDGPLTTGLTSHSTEPSMIISSAPDTEAQAQALLAASLLTLGSTATRPLEQRAIDIHANFKVLAEQQKEVEAHTKVLAELNDELAKLAKEGQDNLKEIGDVQNWAELLERDLLVLEEVDRIVAEDGEEADGEGNNSGRKNGDKSKRRWWSRRW